MASKTKGSRAGRISRRTFLAGVGAAAATGALPLVDGFPAVLRARGAEAQQQFTGKSIRIMTWSDIEGRMTVEHVGKPFERNTGAKVVAELVGSNAEMIAKLKASRAKPQYDVVILSNVAAIELAKDGGLLERPDTSKLPNLSGVIPKFRSGALGFGVGWYLWTDGIIYSKRVFASPPDTWEVLWDEKHTRKLFLPPPQWSTALELTVMAARLAGGSDRNPEPGFKKLAELKGRVLTLGESPPQLAELFRAGSLNVGGPYGPSHLRDFIPKAEYAIGAARSELKEGFFAHLQLMVMPKGHPGDSDVVHAFMNYALDPTVQGKMSDAVWYGPINRDAVVPPGARDTGMVLTTEEVEKRGITLDEEYLSTVRPEWTRRLTEIFGT